MCDTRFLWCFIATLCNLCKYYCLTGFIFLLISIGGFDGLISKIEANVHRQNDQYSTGPIGNFSAAFKNSFCTFPVTICVANFYIFLLQVINLKLFQRRMSLAKTAQYSDLAFWVKTAHFSKLIERMRFLRFPFQFSQMIFEL